MKATADAIKTTMKSSQSQARTHPVSLSTSRTFCSAVLVGSVTDRLMKYIGTANSINTNSNNHHIQPSLPIGLVTPHGDARQALCILGAQSQRTKQKGSYFSGFAERIGDPKNRGAAVNFDRNKLIEDRLYMLGRPAKY